MQVNRNCYYEEGCGTRKGQCELYNPKECPNFTPKKKANTMKIKDVDDVNETLCMKIKVLIDRHIIKYLRRLKWFFQKVFLGYSNVDLWNLDNHLAKIILPRLIAFKKMPRMGVPGDLCKEPQSEKEFEESSRQWEIILDSMIEAFTLIVKDEWKDVKDLKEQTKKIDKGLKNFAIYFRGLWD